MVIALSGLRIEQAHAALKKQKKSCVANLVTDKENETRNTFGQHNTCTADLSSCPTFFYPFFAIKKKILNVYDHSLSQRLSPNLVVIQFARDFYVVNVPFIPAEIFTEAKLYDQHKQVRFVHVKAERPHRLSRDPIM